MRFEYVKYDDLRNLKQMKLKEFFEEIEGYANINLIEGRAKSLFMTKLEECYMWAGKALRDEQIKENKNEN
jgi:hypothetical protein